MRSCQLQPSLMHLPVASPCSRPAGSAWFKEEQQSVACPQLLCCLGQESRGNGIQSSRNSQGFGTSDWVQIHLKAVPKMTEAKRGEVFSFVTVM